MLREHKAGADQMWALYMASQGCEQILRWKCMGVFSHITSGLQRLSSYVMQIIPYIQIVSEYMLIFLTIHIKPLWIS